MINILRDESLNPETHIGILEVRYPDQSEWDIDGFEALKDKELAAIKEEGKEYDRDTWFRQEPYFRYFRKFKKTFPVMMQVESFLLKDRPYPEGKYVNSVAFLTELKTRGLMGTHDEDKVIGDLVFYGETEKTDFPSLHGEVAHSYPGDATGKDDGGIIISMIAGADDRTCLNENSRNALYFAFGTPGMSEDVLNGYLDQLEVYAKTLAPTAETNRKMI